MGEKIKINLCSVQKAQKFLQVVRRFESDIDIMTDTASRDAKSVVGVFTLDLSQDTYVRIISADEKECDRFCKEMEEFQ